MEKRKFRILLLGILIVLLALAIVSNVFSNNDDQFKSPVNNSSNNNNNTSVSPHDGGHDFNSERWVSCPICGELIDTWTTHHTHSNDIEANS